MTFDPIGLKDHMYNLIFWFSILNIQATIIYIIISIRSPKICLFALIQMTQILKAWKRDLTVQK